LLTARGGCHGDVNIAARFASGSPCVALTQRQGAPYMESNFDSRVPIFDTFVFFAYILDKFAEI
jgi:hypothetical protein